MIKIFHKYTEWVPLGNYSFGGTDYVVFVKKNKKTGMMVFKAKKANPSFHNNSFLPLNLIDIKKSWEIIKNL